MPHYMSSFSRCTESKLSCRLQSWISQKEDEIIHYLCVRMDEMKNVKLVLGSQMNNLISSRQTISFSSLSRVNV